MSNLSITGTLVALQRYEILPRIDFINYDSYDVLSSLSSVSTGNKTISGKFSDYKLLVFSLYNSSSGGWISTIMPVKTFQTLTNLDSNGVWVEQNMSTTNRRAALKYVSDTQYNVRYINNASQLKIWGIKNFTS